MHADRASGPRVRDALGGCAADAERTGPDVLERPVTRSGTAGAKRGLKARGAADASVVALPGHPNQESDVGSTPGPGAVGVVQDDLVRQSESADLIGSAPVSGAAKPEHRCRVYPHG